MTRARPPSLVRSSRPSVLMSSRPIATTRGRSSGRLSNTVGRPCGSRAVVTSPRGLWKIHKRVRSRGGSGSPSIVMRSSAVTLTAGEASTSPLSVTRPSAIIASASRREAMPARAMTLAMRSSVGSGGGAGTSAARGRGGRSSRGRSETWRAAGLVRLAERTLADGRAACRRRSGICRRQSAACRRQAMPRAACGTAARCRSRRAVPIAAFAAGTACRRLCGTGDRRPRGGEPRWSGRPRGGRRPLSFPSLSAMGC